jgi:V8-like Glu-specific endopeptidase
LFWEPHDIAIIVTDTNIGDNSSWLTVGSRSNHELLDRNYIVAGYSGASNGSERQGEVAVTVGSVEGDRVRLSIETPPGMEGGPIFERAARGRPGEPDVWAIVGVQIGANRGMRIPDEMRRILDRFLRDDFSGVNANIPLPRR